MSQSSTISVAFNFSKEPAGRYLTDGDASGEAFRTRVLVPELERAGRVTVILDGTEGYGSSFLEEAFGGLVRQMGWTPQEFESRVSFVSNDDPTLVEEIMEYVNDEAQRQRGSEKARK